MTTFLRKTFCMVLFVVLCAGVLNAQTVNPVKSLTGNCINNGKVTLNWTAPDLSLGNGFWLTYSSNDIMGTIGAGVEGEIRSVARFTAADLTAKGVTAGDKIALLQYALNGDGCSDLKLQVYDGGMMLLGFFISGTLRVDQPVDMATVGNKWTNTILTNPHPIDLSKELWFGFSVYAREESMPLAYDWGPGVENKSDLLWTMSSLGIGMWSTLYSASQNQYSLNACIKAFVSKVPIPLVSKYYIYQDGEKIGETTATTFTKDDVEFGQHNFCVVAVYDNSAQSAEVCKTITCTETCSVPTNLTIEYSENCDTAIIAWAAPTAGFPVAYNVYRDNVLIAGSIEETNYADVTFENTKDHKWSVATICKTVSSNKVNEDKTACKTDDGVYGYIKEVSIYPNPASQTVTIQVENFLKVEVYNIFGQLIESKNNPVVDVSSYNSGIYFFKVIDQENNFANRRVSIVR